VNKKKHCIVRQPVPPYYQAHLHHFLTEGQKYHSAHTRLCFFYMRTETVLQILTEVWSISRGVIMSPLPQTYRVNGMTHLHTPEKPFKCDILFITYFKCHFCCSCFRRMNHHNIADLYNLDICILL
jgi:hypothetical protein